MHSIPRFKKTLYKSGNVENAEFNIHSQRDSLWTSRSSRRQQSLHTYPGNLSRDFFTSRQSDTHATQPSAQLNATQTSPFHTMATQPCQAKFPRKCLLIAASTMFLPWCLNARRDCAQHYLLESFHVLEVESNVKKAQVGIDEFKLQRRRGLKTSASLNQSR